MKKTLFFGLLIIVLAFGFIACDGDVGSSETYTAKWGVFYEGEEGDFSTVGIGTKPSEDTLNFINLTIAELKLIIDGLPYGKDPQERVGFSFSEVKKLLESGTWFSSGYGFPDNATEILSKLQTDGHVAVVSNVSNSIYGNNNYLILYAFVE